MEEVVEGVCCALDMMAIVSISFIHFIDTGWIEDIPVVVHLFVKEWDEERLLSYLPRTSPYLQCLFVYAMEQQSQDVQWRKGAIL